jgi:uncharacterized damage-inducible protein DinB
VPLAVSEVPLPKPNEVPLAPEDSLVRALEIHFRINTYLLENLDPQCWRAEPPTGKGRTVAALAAHMHGVHCMWLKAAGAAEIPTPLDKTTLTIDDAKAALEQSGALLSKLVAASLASGKRIKNFQPDTTAFVAYLIAHDSHHRGQIGMLARQVGFPLSKTANFGMWEWGKR